MPLMVGAWDLRSTQAPNRTRGCPTPIPRSRCRPFGRGGKGDRSMFSDHAESAGQVLRPKNGPSPARGLGRPLRLADIAPERVVPAANRKAQPLVGDVIHKRQLRLPAGEIAAEQLGDVVVSPGGLPAHVRGNHHLRHLPELALRRQRLGIGHVHYGPGQPPAGRAATRSASTTSGPRATLTSRAPGFILASAARRSCPGSTGSAAPRVPGHPPAARSSSSRSAGQRASTYGGLSTGNRSVASMRVSKAAKSWANRRAHAAQADDPHGAAGQVAGGPADELFFRFGAEEGRQAPAPGRSSARSCARPPGRPAPRRRW